MAKILDPSLLAELEAPDVNSSDAGPALTPPAQAAAAAPPSSKITDPALLSELNTPEDLSWGDVASQAIGNLPSSAGKLASGMWTSVRHPVQTFETLAHLGNGALNNVGLGRFQPKDYTPEEAARDSAIASAVGKQYADRYGSMRGFKKAVAEDPLSVAMDVSTVAGGVGGLAAKASAVPGMTRLANFANRVSRVTNPITAPIDAARAMGPAVSSYLGMSTGAGENAIAEAARAGYRPGGSQGFLDAIAGRGQPGDVVDQGMRAMSDIQRDASSAYQTGTAGMRANMAPIDIRPLHGTLGQLWDEVAPNGFVKSDQALGTFRDVANTIGRFQRNGLTHSGAIDDLKQAIGEIKQGLPANATGLQRRIVNEVYGAVRNMVAKNNPGYSRAMEDYSAFKDTLDELRRTLSLNDRATTDTTLRKLQSVMRNNANTNYGAREQLIRDAIAPRAPELLPTLAGHALNTWSSRGIARATSGPLTDMLLTGAIGHSISPWALLSLPTLSPKLMGYGAYRGGRATGIVARALQRAGITAPVVRGAAAGTFYPGSATDQEQTLGAFQ